MATITALGFTIFSSYDGSGTSEARRDINNLKSALDDSNASIGKSATSFASLSTAALALGPAVMPLAPAIAAVGAATVTMAASAGSALGIYGLAMKSAIEASKDLADAGDKNAKQFLKASDDMSAAWQKLIKSTTGDTLKPAATAVEGVTAAIGKLKPVIEAVGPIVQDVADKFKAWASGSGMDRFVDTILTSGVPALKSLVNAGRDVITVLGEGFRAFAPMGVTVAEALERGAEALKKWAVGGGFERFIETVRQNAPEVKEFFKALGDAIQTVSDVMRDMGPFALTLTGTLLKLIAALPPQLIADIALGILALRAAMLAWAVASGIAAAAQLALVIACSPFFLLMAGAALTIGLVVIAIAALAFGIYELVTHWAGFSHAMGTAWNATWNAMKVAAETVWRWMQTAWRDTVGALSAAWSAVSGAFSTAWNAVWNALKTAAEAVWNALKTAWNAVATAFSTAWTAVGNALKTAWSAVWNALKTAAEAVWNALKAAWNAVVTAFKTVWDTVSGILKTAWSLVWNSLKNDAQTIWNALKTAWNAVVQAFKTVWDTVSGALKTAWNAVWNALKTAAQAVWNAMKTAWDAIVKAFQTVWTTVSGALKTAWQTFWNLLKTTAQTVWNAIKAAWQAIVQGLKTVWDTVSNALKTAWQAVWNFLKTTAQTVWNAIKAAWQAIVDGIKTAWDTASSALKTAWQAVWDWIKSTAQTIWDWIKDTWQTLVDGVNEIWDKASTTLKTAWDATWNSLKSTAQTIWDGIKTVVSNAVNFIIDIINGLIGAWNAVAGAVGLPTIGTLGHVGGGGGGGSVAPGAGIGGSGPSFLPPTPGAGIGGSGPTFATGGVLDGYSPGVDSVQAMLSPGEGVLVPEAVRGLGENFVHGANHHFSGGRAGSPVSGFGRGGVAPTTFGSGFAAGGMVPGYATGGIIPPIPGLPDVVGGIVGSITGTGSGVVKEGLSALGIPDIGQVTASFMKWINEARGMGGPLGGMGQKAGDLGMKMLAKIIEKIQAMIAALAAKAGGALGGAISGKVGDLAGLAAKALGLAGLNPNQLQAFLSLIQKESGGNPNAINLTDSNAAKGTPSIGLAQVIGPTFAAYALPGLNSNIYDPLSNLAASANYIANVYGGNVPGSPYADGTSGATPGFHLVGEHGPEMRWFNGGESVADASTTRMALRGTSSQGGDTYEFNFDCRGSTVESIQELRRPETLDKLKQAVVAGVGKRRYGR